MGKRVNQNRSQKIQRIEKHDAEQIIDLLDKLPTESRARVLSTVMVRSGPLPMASEFEHYELVTPGAGDRILSMAESQSKHRQSLENEAIKKQFTLASHGQIFALILGILSISGATFLIYQGKDITGLVMFVTSVGGMIGTFIYGNREKK